MIYLFLTLGLFILFTVLYSAALMRAAAKRIPVVGEMKRGGDCLCSLCGGSWNIRCKDLCLCDKCLSESSGDEHASRVATGALADGSPSQTDRNRSQAQLLARDLSTKALDKSVSRPAIANHAPLKISAPYLGFPKPALETRTEATAKRSPRTSLGLLLSVQKSVKRV